jgi:hypothetical protein
MATPAFTAEASIYMTGRRFARSYASPTSVTGVVPQDTCGACSCDAQQCCHSNSAGCWCGSCTPHFEEAVVRAPLMIR